MSTNEKSVFGQIKYISEIALNVNSKGYTILDDILFSDKFIWKKKINKKKNKKKNR